ncbi:TPA: metallophosphoesterase [Klebsiella pneumoniae]|nr:MULTISPECIES: metallophosphoesterase [Enterobacteriaceae]HAV1457605.1 calcineurin phosphoesterase [Enterobacter hormaechei subsp. steigerwaltii]MBV5125559.1 metallophosphoesterase [Klebsiella pneumoniae]MBW5747021.1 calcineurin phosphoesterase [Klebsiella pneumoniae]MCM5749067.1 metallophosphoesterase [Klebsiella pneumoniae]MCY0044435.1 metallophosphoesterase [Klebsiella pneumoniae]
MNCKTIILRFRDLVTPAGETITLHQDIIKSKESVWWGWWAKADEQCPRDFNILKTKISEKNPLEIYLFDSGQLKIYVANLIGISTNFDKHSCPVRDMTPPYYSDQQYSVWFNFSSIAEVTDCLSLINGLAYSGAVNDFFKNNDMFQIYSDKQISSLLELRCQDRTIWFVDEFDSSKHKTHEIILSNANVSVPSVFQKKPIELTEGRLLWLSDLHFDENKKYHQFDQRDQKKLSAIIKDWGQEVEGVLISGDITWRATENEFKQAQEFIENLCSSKRVNIDGIGMCPGNHDVSFSEGYSTDVKNALEKYHEMQHGEGRLSNDEWESLIAVDVLPEFKRNYEKFFRNIVSTDANQYLSMGKRFLIMNQKVVDVCFLNSNSLQQHKLAFQGQGYVGVKQRDDAATEMEWKRNKKITGGYRVVVLHHNLYPVNYAETPYIGVASGLVYDTEAILKWCFENGVDLILHGHTHERCVTKISRKVDNQDKSVWIVSLGSTGVIQGHLVGCNEFAELDFEGDRIKVMFYNIKHNTIENNGEIILD